MYLPVQIQLRALVLVSRVELISRPSNALWWEDGHGWTPELWKLQTQDLEHYEPTLRFSQLLKAEKSMNWYFLRCFGCLHYIILAPLFSVHHTWVFGDIIRITVMDSSESSDYNANSRIRRLVRDIKDMQCRIQAQKRMTALLEEEVGMWLEIAEEDLLQLREDMTTLVEH